MTKAPWSTVPMLVALFLCGDAEARGRKEPIPCPDDVPTAVALECPCEGRTLSDQTVEPWRNHGRYVSCVARYRNQLRKSGCLTSETKRTIARCAARSSCGKATAVVCCVPTSTGVCNDAMPGDDLPNGTCSNDAAIACDTDAGCVVASPRMTKSADACSALGGSSLGAGSLCTASCGATEP